MEEQAERRRLGLCYNCNEPYSRGHNRVCRRIFYIDGVELAEDEPAEEAPVYSLHAGVPVGGTLQLAVQVGAAKLIALIDTGSTHCFIGEAAAQQVGLPVEPRPRLTTTVANGERIACLGVLRQAPIVIDSLSFAVDLYIMPLAGYDLVLGTQWLATLGDIVWNVAAGTMEFTVGDQQVCWRSVAPTTPPHIHSASVAEPLLNELLAAFADVFTEPRGLPPARGHAHHIILKPDTVPVAVRPYRYPATHKTELEQQCKTMIENDIVWRSDSAFSSPVLLVKKPDGSWRFCVDYRALNAVTVKDVFPIPVVNELLDELHGTKYFTKLDLRSAYHQVRIGRRMSTRWRSVHTTVSMSSW
jgi:hypothetical protein